MSKTKNGRVRFLVQRATGLADRALHISLSLAVCCCLASASAYADLSDGLVVHYTFDGDANDVTGNGYDGTVIGASLAPDRFGQADSAFVFDGDDYIVADATGLPETERTIALWMLVTGDLTRPWNVAVGYGNGCESTWIMLISETDYHVITHCNPVPALSYVYSCEPKDLWTHYAITIDATGSKIYINGAEKLSTPTVVQTNTAGTDLAIGVATHAGTGSAPYTDTNVGYFKGSIDDVRIYDRALSAAEIGQLAEGVGDQDSDGIDDSLDNCVLASNPEQTDFNDDGLGDACDADIAPAANDCVVNFLDLQVLKNAFFLTPASPNWNPDADLNSDGIVNFIDLNIMSLGFFGPPGPSAVFNDCSCEP